MASNPLAAPVELEATLDQRTRDLLARRRRLTVRRRGWLVRRALLAADVVGLVGAFVVAQLLTNNPSAPVNRFAPQTELLLFLLSLPAWILLAKLYGLYVRDEERADHSTADDLVGVFHLVTLGTWSFFAVTWLSGIAHPQLVRMAIFWALAVGAIPLSRAVARAICRRQVEYVQNTVIVGTGETARLVARKVRSHPEYGLNLVGFLACDSGASVPDAAPLLGDRWNVSAIVDALDVERVVVACPEAPRDETIELIRGLKRRVQVDVVPHYFPVIVPGNTVHGIEGLPLLSMPPHRLPRSSMALKRATDIVLAIVGLALLAPVMVAGWLAIRLDSGGPTVFRQLRIGAGGKPFIVLKFRTMTHDADTRKAEVAHLNVHAGNGDGRMFKIPDDPRVTRVGRFLRRYSLDELPQLVNVLRGEMSIVGPRPLIVDEHAHVADWAAERSLLKPGLTGPWQVTGRSHVPFGEMVSMDYEYVQRWSVLGDLKLILRTIPVVFRATGAH